MKITKFPCVVYVNTDYYRPDCGIRKITVHHKCGTPSEKGLDRYYAEAEFKDVDVSYSVVLHEDEYGKVWAFTKEELQ